MNSYFNSPATLIPVSMLKVDATETKVMTITNELNVRDPVITIDNSLSPYQGLVAKEVNGNTSGLVKSNVAKQWALLSDLPGNFNGESLGDANYADLHLGKLWIEDAAIDVGSALSSLSSGIGNALSVDVKQSGSQLDIGNGINTNTINIGSRDGPYNINIGSGTDDTIKIYGNLIQISGTTTLINTTDTDVQDMRITLNKGGSNSGGCGIDIEENKSIAGYIRIANDKNSIVMKAPNISEFGINQSLLTTSSPTFAGINLPNASISTSKLTGTITNDQLEGKITSDKITSLASSKLTIDSSYPNIPFNSSGRIVIGGGSPQIADSNISVMCVGSTKNMVFQLDKQGVGAGYLTNDGSIFTIGTNLTYGIVFKTGLQWGSNDFLALGTPHLTIDSLGSTFGTGVKSTGGMSITGGLTITNSNCITSDNIAGLNVSKLLAGTNTNDLSLNGQITFGGTNYPQIKTNSANRLCFGESGPPGNETGTVVCYGSGSNTRNMIFTLSKTAVKTGFFGNSGSNMVVGIETGAGIQFRTGMVYNSSDILASGTLVLNIPNTGAMQVNRRIATQTFKVTIAADYKTIQQSGNADNTLNYGDAGVILIESAQNTYPNTWFNFPTSPTEGEQITVINNMGLSDTTNLTNLACNANYKLPNGTTVVGSETNGVITLKSVSVFQYVSGSWRLISRMT